jgi:hypothetical protein
MSLLPYSVLNSKRLEKVKIIENKDTMEIKTTNIDFEKQVNLIRDAGLEVDQEDLDFIYRNIGYFYRNNLAVLLVTMKIISHGELFINSKYYQPYVNFIARKELKDDKLKSFNNKFNIQVNAYKTKIENLKKRINP